MFFKKLISANPPGNSYIDCTQWEREGEFRAYLDSILRRLAPPTYESHTLTVTLSGPTTAPGGQTVL